MAAPLLGRPQLCWHSPRTPSQHSVQPPLAQQARFASPASALLTAHPLCLTPMDFKLSSSFTRFRVTSLFTSLLSLNWAQHPRACAPWPSAYNSTVASAPWVHPRLARLAFLPCLELEHAQGTKDIQSPSLLRPQDTVPGANGLGKTQQSVWDLKCIYVGSKIWSIIWWQ